MISGQLIQMGGFQLSAATGYGEGFAGLRACSACVITIGKNYAYRMNLRDCRTTQLPESHFHRSADPQTHTFNSVGGWNGLAEFYI